MESFEHKSVKYTLRNRSYHRENEGGYEKWVFETNGKKYYMDGDIRYLPKTNDKVLYVDFYSQDSLDTGSEFTVTNTEGYSALHIINCVAELVVNRIPYYRYYKYLAFPCPPSWEGLITTLINKYGTLVTDNSIKEEIEENLNYGLTVLIDSDFYTCYIGRLTN